MQLKISSQKIWFFQNPIDFRRSLDGLIQEIKHHQKEPNEGLYLFYNKARTRVKGVCWHKNGFLMIYKRLERGRFGLGLGGRKHYEINQEEFEWLMAGLDWARMRQWGELSYKKFS